MIGIYEIRNKKNEKVYIGQSVDTDARFARHIRDLKRGTHYNIHLQRSFNKYGENQFELLALEECKESQLTEKEQKWIDKHPRQSLYNQQFEVYDLQGERNPFFGKKHTDESKKKMSEWKKANYTGESNPNYGKKQPKEVCLKMVQNNSRTKLTQEKVLKIVILLKEGKTHAEIAVQFGIGRTVVTRISNGTRWTNITGGPVVPVIYQNGVRQFSQLHRDRIGAKRKGQKHTKETKAMMREKALNRK